MQLRQLHFKMQVLIAGAGDLGALVAHLLRAEGATTTAITRSGGDGRIAADLSSASDIAPLIAHADAVIFSAAPSARSEQAYRTLFVDGLQNILRMRHLQPVLFCSSTAVYGENNGAWVDESTACEPSTFNGRILVEAENLLRPGDIALRLGGIYGPRFSTSAAHAAAKQQFPANSVRDFARRQALSGTAPLAQHWTNRIHLADAARAIVFALKLPTPPLKLNLVDNEPCTQKALYETLRIAAGLVPVPPIDAPASGKRVANTRLRQLGFACQYPSYREGYASLSTL